MFRTPRSAVVVRGAMACWLVGLAGCVAPVGRSEPSEIVASESKLLATLQLSDTHQIQFREEPYGQVAMIESRSIDTDKNEPTYAVFDGGELKLAQAYQLMAGDLANDTDLRALQEADARHAVLRKDAALLNARAGSAKVAYSAPEPDARGADAPAVAAPGPELVEKANDCNAAWDWTADAAYWKSELCDSQSLDCRMNMSWASYAWWTTTNYAGAGIAQDMCNTARLYVRYQVTQPPFLPCFGNGGIAVADLYDITINPRYEQAVYASGGGTGTCDVHFAYSTRVEKRAGPNGSRVGIVVNPKSFGPCRRGCFYQGGVCACPQ